MNLKYLEVGYLNNPALFGAFASMKEANAKQEEVLYIASENVFITRNDNGEVVSWMKPRTPSPVGVD